MPNRIAYVSGGPDSGLEFTTGPAGARSDFGSPSWSPDGRRIVYHSSRDGKSHLLLVDSETGEVKALDTGSNKENFPAWSPVGDLIAFTSYREGNYDIYTIRPDGTDLKRLTDSPGNEVHCS